MEIVTKEYLQDNIKSYDEYRKLDKIGQANGIATLDANGKVPASQIPDDIGGPSVTYEGQEVTSLTAGDNVTMTYDDGDLTIKASGGTSGPSVTYEGQEVTSLTAGDNVTMTYDDGDLTIKASGGIKANVGGSKTIQHTWTNPGTETVTTNTNPRNVTVYAPVGSNDGKYYPVETTTDNAAVVCIPNVSHPTASTSGIGGFKAAGSVNPSTINHITTGNYYSVDIVNDGDNKDQAVVCVPTSSGGGSGTAVTYDNKNVTSITVGSGIKADISDSGTLTLTRDDIWDTSSSGGKRPTITGTNSSGTINVDIKKPSSANIMVVEYNKDSYGTTIFVTKSDSTRLTDLGLTAATGSIAYLKITIADSDRTYKPFIGKLEWISGVGVVPGWYN